MFGLLDFKDFTKYKKEFCNYLDNVCYNCPLMLIGDNDSCEKNCFENPDKAQEIITDYIINKKEQSALDWFKIVVMQRFDDERPWARFLNSKCDLEDECDKEIPCANCDWWEFKE